MNIETNMRGMMETPQTIDIYKVNKAIRMVNQINFMIGDIIQEINEYVLLDMVGVYTETYDESQYYVDQGNNTIVIHTSCTIYHGSVNTQSIPFVRDETLLIPIMAIDPNRENEAYNIIFNEKLNMIKNHVEKEKNEILARYKNILGAENLIDSYIRRGLIIERRD